MTAIVGVKTIIQTEEVRARAAVSEATQQRIGAAVNFIQNYEYSEKQWFINGQYNLLTIPFVGIDGLVLMNFKATIINAFMFVKTAGSGGDLSLDVKYATTPGGAFTSVFSTAPVINYQAGNFAWCYVGTAFTNTTAPVIGTPTMAAGNVLRCDILSGQTGVPFGAGLILHYQVTS